MCHRTLHGAASGAAAVARFGYSKHDVPAALMRAEPPHGHAAAWGLYPQFDSPLVFTSSETGLLLQRGTEGERQRPPLNILRFWPLRQGVWRPTLRSERVLDANFEAR